MVDRELLTAVPGRGTGALRKELRVVRPVELLMDRGLMSASSLSDRAPDITVVPDKSSTNSNLISEAYKEFEYFRIVQVPGVSR
jgi:hypothetical protein